MAKSDFSHKFNKGYMDIIYPKRVSILVFMSEMGILLGNGFQHDLLLHTLW